MARLLTTIDGVEIDADPATGNVFWMSDWSRCDELANRGLLRRKSYGPATYGHVDFFVPLSPMVLRALSGTLPADAHGARAFVR